MSEKGTPTTEAPVEQPNVADLARNRLSFDEPAPVVETPSEEAPAEGVPAAEVVAEETPATPEEKQPEATEDDRAKALRTLREQMEGKAPATEIKLIPKEVETWATQSGYDIKDIQGLHELKANLLKESTKTEQLQSRLDRFSALPTKLRNAIEAADRQDPNWEKHITAFASNVDFSKPFDKQDKLEIVKAMGSTKLNEQITDDQWQQIADGDADAETQARFDASYEVARSNYDIQGKEVEGYLTKQQQAYKEQSEKLEQSRTASVQALMTKFPAAKPFTEEIAKAMTPHGVLNLFFDPKDNTLRPDAAEAIMSLTLHKELVQPRMEAQVRRAKEDAILDQVRRTPEMTPAAESGAAGKSQSPGEMATQLARKKLSFS